jgi:hypothetical protein
VSHGIQPVQGGQSQVWARGGPHGLGPMHRVLDSVSPLLGVDAKDLVKELRSGKSLADVATEKGVTRDDLLAVVTEALASGPGKSGHAAGPPSVDPATLAQQMVDRKGFGSPPPADPPPPRDSTQGTGTTDFGHAFSDLSESLGLSESDLVQALQSGTSLEAIAAQHGVPRDVLVTLFGQGSLVDTSA